MNGVGSIRRAMLRGGLRFNGGTSCVVVSVEEEEDRRVDVLVFVGNSDVDSLDGVANDDVCFGSDDEDGVNAVAIVANVIVKADVCIVFIVCCFLCVVGLLYICWCMYAKLRLVCNKFLLKKMIIILLLLICY